MSTLKPQDDECHTPEIRGVEAIAIDVLHVAVKWDPDTRIMLTGNVVGIELARLAASVISGCPKCGADAWCNIDCDLCVVCSVLQQGKTP